MSTTTTPTQEEIDDLILSARFGELEEVKEFTDKFGWDALVAARDERGNSVLHMVCGNGHLGEFPVGGIGGGVSGVGAWSRDRYFASTVDDVLSLRQVCGQRGSHTGQFERRLPV